MKGTHHDNVSNIMQMQDRQDFAVLNWLRIGSCSCECDSMWPGRWLPTFRTKYCNPEDGGVRSSLTRVIIHQAKY